MNEEQPFWWDMDVKGLNSSMTNSIDILRRHIALLEEAGVRKVSVRVSRYEDTHGTLKDNDAIPSTFYFEYPLELDRDATTATIKADVLASTGYEPLQFRWRYLT